MILYIPTRARGFEHLVMLAKNDEGQEKLWRPKVLWFAKLIVGQSSGFERCTYSKGRTSYIFCNVNNKWFNRK